MYKEGISDFSEVVGIFEFDVDGKEKDELVGGF